MIGDRGGRAGELVTVVNGERRGKPQKRARCIYLWRKADVQRGEIDLVAPLARGSRGQTEVAPGGVVMRYGPRGWGQ
jgi:hypothetical protein